MKRSLAISVILIGLAAVLGWRNHHQLIEAKAAHAEAMGQHRTFSAANPERSTRSRPSRPRKSAADPDTLGSELITLVRALRSETKSEDPATLQDQELQILDLQNRLAAINARQLKSLIKDIRTTDIGDEIRNEILYLLLESLTEHQPLATLEILSDSPDLLSGSPRLSAVNRALERSMPRDPSATIDWFQANRELFSGGDWDSMLATFLSSASSLDPKLAFGLISKTGAANTENAVDIIATAARTAEDRERVLASFRDFLETIPDPAIRDASEFKGLAALVFSARTEGLDRGLPWIEKNLSPTEIETVALRSFPSLTSEETAKWLTWLDQVTPTEKIIKYTITDTLYGWAGYDYQAAEKWMSSLPDGPTRSAVIPIFAITVGTAQPDKASEWIIRLPAEKQPEVVESILQRWPPSDPTGAAAFKEKHGID